jgi:hypothetical protein
MAAVFAVPLTAAEESKRPITWDKLHAQKSKRQRAIIQDFFRGRRDGTFVDVGSAHYRDGSMTFFLEKEFGWSGVAIDALEPGGDPRILRAARISPHRCLPRTPQGRLVLHVQGRSRVRVESEGFARWPPSRFSIAHAGIPGLTPQPSATCRKALT